MTRRWLMQHPDVLAYVEPRQGMMAQSGFV